MRIRSIILLLMITSLLLVSCGGTAPATQGQTAEPTEEMEEPTQEDAGATEEAMSAPATIKIGAVVPLTGAFAGGGAQVQRGYEMAVADINEAGGVFVEQYGAQIPLELILLDDESDPNNTVSNLETLNSENEVVAYLGGFGSSLHAAAAAIAEKNEVPYIGVAFALYSVHQQGYRYLFSPFPKSPGLAVAVFDLLDAQEEKPTRVAILQEQTDWGVELAELWTQEAQARGYEIVAHEEYAPGSTDFTDSILRIQQADAQVLLALPTPPDGVTIYRQMGELGYAPPFAMLIRAPDVPTWRDLGTVGDYVTLAPGWHNAMTFPGVDELNAAHMELMDRPADPIVGPSYAAVQILADAIQRAGSLDRQAIRDAIAATDLDTVVGHVTFNEDGTGNVPVAILQYQMGNVELVWPEEFATADLAYPAPPYDER
jgi:branched-chain amino acid transport system substrate-binding protein